MTNSYSFETFRVGNKLYRKDLLDDVARSLPMVRMSLENLKAAADVGHKYWLDKQGRMFGPYQLLANWEAAQENSDWSLHVETIKKSDLNQPLWVTKDNLVIDGMHRLTRAILDNRRAVLVKIFKHLPGEAIIKES